MSSISTQSAVPTNVEVLPGHVLISDIWRGTELDKLISGLLKVHYSSGNTLVIMKYIDYITFLF